jgi:hypothetical protein
VFLNGAIQTKTENGQRWRSFDTNNLMCIGHLWIQRERDSGGERKRERQRERERE